MLDPTDTLRAIFSIAKSIYDQVQLVKINQMQSRRLVERIQIVEKTLHGLEQIPQSAQFRLALHQFKEYLDGSLFRFLLNIKIRINQE